MAFFTGKYYYISKERSGDAVLRFPAQPDETNFISRTGRIRFRVGRTQIKQLRLCGKKSFYAHDQRSSFSKGGDD